MSFKKQWLPVSAAVIGVMLLGGACDRAERAADKMAEAAEDRAKSILAKRDEEQLRAALRKLQDVAARTEVATLYRVANEFDPDYGAVAAPTRAKVAGYPIRRQAAIARRDAQPLVSVLTNRQTYFPAGEGWTCMFEPHDVLVLAAGQESVTVVICTKCGDVELLVGGESIGTRSVLAGPNAELSRTLKGMLSASTVAERQR